MFDRFRLSILPVVLCVSSAGMPVSIVHAESIAMDQPARPDTPADQAMTSGMKTMQHAMSHAVVTGNPDHDFVSMMTPHHQGAIEMAQVELRYGKDPALRALARDIIAAQEREIVQMNAWMAAHPSPAN